MADTVTEQRRIGIDLGGTKIEGITMDADGTLVDRRRIATPRNDYEGVLAAIHDLTKQLGQGAVLPIGICTPGTISSKTGLMMNSNSICLNDRPFHDDLTDRLGQRPAIANDADCFALSEATDGAGRDARTVFGVILGTGVGGGIVIDGKLVSGPNSIAGEWGHNSLPRPSAEELCVPPCYCGRIGCIETFVSGPALGADHPGEGDPETIVAAAAAGDVEANRTLKRYEDRLGRGLSSVINILDPEVIVLGGGLSSIDRLYTNVPRAWDRHVFSDHVATRLVPPRFGASSGVRGAAWLV